MVQVSKQQPQEEARHRWLQEEQLLQRRWRGRRDAAQPRLRGRPRPRLHPAQEVGLQAPARLRQEEDLLTQEEDSAPGLEPHRAEHLGCGLVSLGFDGYVIVNLTLLVEQITFLEIYKGLYKNHIIHF